MILKLMCIWLVFIQYYVQCGFSFDKFRDYVAVFWTAVKSVFSASLFHADTTAVTRAVAQRVRTIHIFMDKQTECVLVLRIMDHHINGRSVMLK
jgi:hypothetical protein